MNASLVPTFGSHGCGTVLRHRGQQPGVVDVTVGLPAEVSILGVVSGGAGNHFAPDFREKRIYCKHLYVLSANHLPPSHLFLLHQH